MVETLKLVLVRVPPGDNWKEPHNVDSTAMGSLTAGLEHIFQREGTQTFKICADSGEVYAIEYEEDLPPKVYSLYGDE